LRGYILVVEDEPDIRDLLELILRSSGFDIVLARNGLDALHRMQAHAQAPSVVVLDLIMPVMDGWELLEEIPRGTPVIVTSGYVGPPARGVLQYRNVKRVLEKPVDYRDLLSAVAQVAG
jgi:CheY-like chemotaxis protein